MTPGLKTLLNKNVNMYSGVDTKHVVHSFIILYRIIYVYIKITALFCFLLLFFARLLVKEVCHVEGVWETDPTFFPGLARYHGLHPIIKHLL